MAIDERVAFACHRALDTFVERALIGGVGKWLARGALTVVLSVAGCALMVVVLALLQWAPLVVVALIVLVAWRTSARIVAGLDEPADPPPSSRTRRLHCVRDGERGGRTG